MTSRHDAAMAHRPPLSDARLHAYASETIAVDPDGPLYDESAQALALDAVAAVCGDQVWNSLAVTGLTRYEARVVLAQRQIGSADQWTAAVGNALDVDGGDVDVVLGVRTEMMRHGEPLTAGSWRAAMHHWLDDTDQSVDAHSAADRVIDAVTDIDSWIADSGVLAPGLKVRSIVAFRVCHAVSVARWGAHSGYGDAPAVRQTLFAARDIAAAQFADWHEFGASFLAGASLASEHPRTAFDTCLPAIATLLTDPASPWRNLAFPAADLPA